MPATQAPPLEATRVTPYLVFLFGLLSTATLFEGFDSAMMTVAAPDARSALDISRREWGILFGITRTGMIASFFFLLFADRWGRRALMMATVIGFTIFNGLTALATTKVEFTTYQFLARIFLTAEYGLAVIIAAEEFPARIRGRAIAVLVSLAPVGVMLVARIQALVLLEPGAEGNALHDTGAAALAWIQGFLGLEHRIEDWRILYLLGIVPLLLVLVLRFGMRETRRFAAEEGPGAKRLPLLEEVRVHLRNARAPWQAPYRSRTLIVTLLWNCVHLVTAPAVAFWVIYAREDLGFTPGQVGSLLFVGYAGGFVGTFLAGYLVDRIGRRRTCAALYTFAAISVLMLFQTETLRQQYLWIVLTVSSFGAAGTATHIYATELFPTAIRATGYGWTTNLFGRATEVLVPLGMGLLVGTLGIPWSVGLFAFGPVLGAVILLRYAPETRGMTLEQIQDVLEVEAEAKDGDQTAPARVGSAAGS